MAENRSNCSGCPFREWDGIDHVCTAYFDGLPGKAVIYPKMYEHPNWCPLENPRKVNREEVEQAMHPTVAVALQNMYRNNGDKVPDGLHQFPVPEARDLPRGDR